MDSTDRRMYVYSGDFRKCECGLSTGKRDINGHGLRTGDIVLIFTEDYSPSGLTVMVCDQFENYSDGTHIKHDPNVYYAMGIKNGGPKWEILKVKNWGEVVNGEHWRDFGFNYRYEVE